MLNGSILLTTKDNPYSPFDDFDNWYNYDIEHGYNTCDLLGRIAKTSDEWSDADIKEETLRAIAFIIATMPDLYMAIDEDGDEMEVTTTNSPVMLDQPMNTVAVATNY